MLFPPLVAVIHGPGTGAGTEADMGAETRAGTEAKGGVFRLSKMVLEV
jgi:hypothetical protein